MVEGLESWWPRWELQEIKTVERHQMESARRRTEQSGKQLSEVVQYKINGTLSGLKMRSAMNDFYGVRNGEMKGVMKEKRKREGKKKKKGKVRVRKKKEKIKRKKRKKVDRGKYGSDFSTI